MQTTIASDGVLVAAPFSASALAMAIHTYYSSDVPQRRTFDGLKQGTVSHML